MHKHHFCSLNKNLTGILLSTCKILRGLYGRWNEISSHPWDRLYPLEQIILLCIEQKNTEIVLSPCMKVIPSCHFKLGVGCVKWGPVNYLKVPLKLFYSKLSLKMTIHGSTSTRVPGPLGFGLWVPKFDPRRLKQGYSTMLWKFSPICTFDAALPPWTPFLAP